MFFLVIEVFIVKVWLYRQVSTLMAITLGPLCLGVKIGVWLPELEAFKTKTKKVLGNPGCRIILLASRLPGLTDVCAYPLLQTLH